MMNMIAVKEEINLEEKEMIIKIETHETEERIGLKGKN